MILYHGSNVEVNDPKLIPTKRLLDFGAGFYLTSDFEEAKNGLCVRQVTVKQEHRLYQSMRLMMKWRKK